MPGMGYLIAARTTDHWFAVLSLPLLCYGAFFIVLVEMPDIESHRLTGRTNLLVSHRMKAGTTVALVSTALASVLLFTIAYSGALGATVNIWPVALFSLVLLSMAEYGAVRDLRHRSKSSPRSS
jgi:4-hydroxybenzoate polyprenyltransferase